ncbi:Uu.00g141610.m01.CDS01 [Anthostomella pinea]|uniref:Uu.00g141610.m01.CDS01 n=1 Tax=Anthostomella pinea TaxID=933095 RepID=A0AAI8VQD6_9PEZI|nr:Uu.00g141610.m01.CDS01 [Anthostomella pinea]
MTSNDDKNTQAAGPPSVINAGLFRTGTASMAEAYRILGLRPHHGLDLMDYPEHWVELERAAEGTWPDVPGARKPPQQQPFTRADWDRVFGAYDAITDVGSTFAEQLVAAYPEAKVVVVERGDADRWEASFESQILGPIWGPLGQLMYHAVLPLLGNRAVSAMRKILLGAWGARDVAGIRRNAKDGYVAYYAKVREAVPPERRLEYRLGQGWEPLCAFLGKDVPDVEFPWVNESAAHSAKQQEQVWQIFGQLGAKLRPW